MTELRHGSNSLISDSEEEKTEEILGINELVKKRMKWLRRGEKQEGKDNPNETIVKTLGEQRKEQLR